MDRFRRSPLAAIPRRRPVQLRSRKLPFMRPSTSRPIPIGSAPGPARRPLRQEHRPLSAPLGSTRFGQRYLPMRFKEIARRLPRQYPPPAPEATLEEKPLWFGGSIGPIGRQNRQWDMALCDEHRRSFLSLRPRAIPREKLEKWWELLMDKVQWEQPLVHNRRLPRSAAWLTKGGCECMYRYSGTRWPAQQMPSWFQEITEAVCESCGISETPNSCNANLYEDGSQAVGWHSDDESLFLATRQDALIISLSLGATRIFELYPRDEPDNITRLPLSHGDLCTMEGLMQKHYFHRIAKERHVQGARINLTWRWVVNHEDRCPLASKTSTATFPRHPAGSMGSRRPLRQESSLTKEAASQMPAAKRTASLPAEEMVKRQRRQERFEGARVWVSKAVHTTSPGEPSARRIEEKSKREARAERFGTQVKTEEQSDSLPEVLVAPAPSFEPLQRSVIEQQKRLERKQRFAAEGEAAVPIQASPVPPREAKATPVQRPLLAPRASEEQQKRLERQQRFASTRAGEAASLKEEPDLSRAVEVPVLEKQLTAKNPEERERQRQRLLRFASAEESAAATVPQPQPRRVWRSSSVAASPEETSTPLTEAAKRERRAQRFQEPKEEPGMAKPVDIPTLATPLRASAAPLKRVKSENELLKRDARLARFGNRTQ